MAVDIQQFLNVMAKRPQRGVIYSGQMERDEHERQMPVMDDVNVDLQAPGVNVDENVAVTPPNIVRKPSITSEAEWNDDPPEFDRWGNKIKYGNDLPSDGGITGRQRPPLDDAYDQARGAYINAVNAPIEKQPLWKDIIVGGLQGLSNFANRESKPVKLWGRMKHEKAVEDAGRALAPLEAIRTNEQNRLYKQKQMENIDKDNAARDAAALAKAEKEKREFGLKEKTFNFKVEDRAEYYRLEEMKIDALKQNRKDLYELAVRKQDEIERNNQVKTDQTERKGMPKNNVPLPASSFVPPRAATKPPKGALESGLKVRGIKPGSPEYIKVMKAAGY